MTTTTSLSKTLIHIRLRWELGTPQKLMHALYLSLVTTKNRKKSSHENFDKKIH